MSFAQDLVFSQPAGRRALRALSYTAGSLLVALLLVPGLVRPYPEFAADGHMRLSLMQAVGSTFCRSLRLSPQFDVIGDLGSHPDNLDVPIVTLIQRRAGSMDRYCQSLTLPVMNHENSLMFAMAAVLKADPRISVAGLGLTMAVARLLFVSLLVFALFRSGASLLTGVASAVMACCVLLLLAPYQYGQSPFIFACPVLLIGAHLVVLGIRPTRLPAVVAACAALGLLAVFCVNMRTSQLPVILAMFAAFVFAWRRGPGPHPALLPMRTVMFGVGAFIVVAGIAELGAVEAVSQRNATGLPYHVVAHGLVLGLAEPPNALSRRENLQWDDESALALARRLDPGVEYLSVDYEKVLTRYYLNLWRTHPADMLAIYRVKAGLAGSGVLEQAALALEHRWMPGRVTRWLGRQTFSGFPLVALAFATAIGGWMIYRHTASPLGFALSLFSLAVLGTLVECAIILPRFYVFYHGILLFYVLMVPIAMLQLAVDYGRSLAAQRTVYS